jgi:hypothetical protein
LLGGLGQLNIEAVHARRQLRAGQAQLRPGVGLG